MKKIALIITTVIIFSGLNLKAQTQLTSLQYSVGFSSGDMHDFISEVSFRGVNFEYRDVIDETFSVGFEIGWNTFYKKEGYSSIENGTVTATGTQYRYVNAVPVLMTFDYYFGWGENINPYIGLGAGTSWVDTQLDMGLYSFSTDEWHFLLRPSAGVIFQTSGNTSFIVAAKYNENFKTQSAGTKNYFTANVGFVWSY